MRKTEINEVSTDIEKIEDVKIQKTTLPQESVLTTEKEFNFIDGYKADFNDETNEIDIQKIGKLFFSASPKWIDKLFGLRNKIVKLFGLKVAGNTSEREKQLENFKCEPNEQIGLFKVFHKSNSEIILGQDDKHLDFRVSLFLQQKELNTTKKQLTISTSVKFNNRFGKLYFIPVRPFHKFIVPTMLKGIMKNIKNTKSEPLKQEAD